MQHTLVLCELTDANLPAHESYSPFCLKAHRSLRLAGLPYTRRHHANPGAFKKYNATGQVPVLLVDDRPVPDSTAILRELTALTGRVWAHGDARTQAETWMWEDYGDTVMNAFLVAARWADARNWPGVRNAYFAGMPAPVRAIVPNLLRRGMIDRLRAREVWRRGPEACWAQLEEKLALLEDRAPAEGYWMGAEITAADLGLFAQIHSLRTELTAPQAESVAKRANLSRWLDRVHAATAANANADVHASGAAHKPLAPAASA